MSTEPPIGSGYLGDSPDLTGFCHCGHVATEHDELEGECLICDYCPEFMECEAW